MKLKYCTQNEATIDSIVKLRTSPTIFKSVDIAESLKTALRYC